MRVANLSGARFAFTQAGLGTIALRANYGLHVGDDHTVVRQRRQQLAADLGAPLAWMDQTHSTTIQVLTADSHPHSLSEWELAAVEADGIVVDARQLSGAPGAAVMVADCLPALFASADGQCVAAVHAGRKGLLGGILTATVRAFGDLGVETASLSVALGPAACGRCYEVPARMRDEAARALPESASITRWGTPAIDLRAGAIEELRGLGVGEIVDDARCTIEDPLLHSYRRTPAAGRQVGVIVPNR